MIIRPTNRDNTSIANAISQLNDGDTLALGGGEYILGTDGAFVKEVYPTNNDGGIRTIPIYVNGKQNITIDGEGAKLTFTKMLSPIAIEYCDNFTLKNLTIDFAQPLVCQVTVKESNDKYIDIIVDKSTYPYEVKGKNVIWTMNEKQIDADKIYIFDYDNDCMTGRPRYIMAHFVIGSHTDNYADSVMSKTNDGTIYPKFLLTEAQEIADGVIRLSYLPRSKSVIYKAGSRLLLHLTETKRSNDTIFLNSCNNVEVDNVTIHRGPSMGIISQLCSNVNVHNCTIAPDTTRGDLVTTTADSMMFVDCQGTLNVHHNYVSCSIDDGINIHATWVPIDHIDGTKVTAHTGHCQQLGYNPLIAGDEIQFVDSTTLVTLATRKVVSSTLHSDHTTISAVFDSPIDISSPNEITMLNISRQPIVTISHNKYVRSTCLIMTSTHPIEFSNNYVNTLGTAVRARVEIERWYEGCITKSLRVVNNTFDHCGEWSHNYIIRTLLCDYMKLETDICDELIVENNTFLGHNSQVCDINYTTNFVFKGNTLPKDDLFVTDEPKIHLDHVKNSEIIE